MTRATRALAALLAILVILVLFRSAAPSASAQSADRPGPRAQRADPGIPRADPGAQRPATSLPLRLEEAIQRGLDTSHRLAEATARGDAAEAAVAGQRAAMRPQIAGQAGYTRTNHVDAFGVPLPNNQLRILYPDVPDNYRARLDLQWPIYTGGGLEALERATRADAAAASDDLAVARSDLRLEITRAYWALVTATESLRVVEASSARGDAHLLDVRNQLDAGLVPPSDVLMVEAQQSRQRVLTIQARVARDNAEADLARLVGAPAGTSIDPVSPLLPNTPPEEAGSVDALIETARQQRSEREALLKRIAAAEQRETAAAAGAKPAVAVGGGVDYARPNPRIFPREGAWKSSWDASVNVNWPLFDGGRNQAARAGAAAAVHAIRERLAEFDTVLAVEVRQRAAELDASRLAIAAADDAVRSATEARRVLGERFTAGVATSTDVLDAQVALLAAELDRTHAIANARLAEARLTRALGR